MVRRSIDRRTAVVTLAGIMAGAGGLGFLTSPSTPRTPGTPVTLARDGDVDPDVPAYWAELNPVTRAQFTGLHAAIQSLESHGQQARVHGYLQSVMALPQGADHWKHLICTYIRDLRRADLVADLMPGLSPAITSDSKRAKIAVTLCQASQMSGGSAVPRQVRSQVKAYLASNVESDPTVLLLLQRALEEL